MLIDKDCFERGCACYDVRNGDEPVEVVRKGWVELTDEEYDELLLSGDWGGSLIQATQAKLKEKNS